MALAEPRAAPSRNVSPLRIWLTEFLFIRGFCREVPGIALYRYNVTPNEFAELRELLQKHHDHALHPTYGTSWAPAFCLYVAEMYRRQYDAKAISWAWAPFESLVDCQFTPQQRGQLVRLGLEYWKRPVRKWRRLSDKFEDGRDNLLGSLFTEGGLPWPLVQRDTHSFGRVVGKGLKYHYRTEAGLRTTADLLADFVEDLPQTFRDSPETLHLLAGVVEQLMELATRHELRDKEDPARYLDSVEAGWRNDFPLPLDEANARNLVVCGNVATCNTPLVPGLTTGMVSVCDASSCPGTCKRQNTGQSQVNLVVVQVSGLAFRPMASWIMPAFTFDTIIATMTQGTGA